MNAEQKHNLQSLIAILYTADAYHKAHNEPVYDQSMLIHESGTPACAMGHWLYFKHNDLFKESRNHVFCMDEIAEKDFGLDVCDSIQLFSVLGCNCAKTAQQAADYIREWLVTQNV